MGRLCINTFRDFRQRNSPQTGPQSAQQLSTSRQGTKKVEIIYLFTISDFEIWKERFSSCSGCDETAEDDFDKRLEARAEASKRQLQKLSWPEDTHTAVLEIQVAKMLITRLGSLKPIRFCVSSDLS